MNNTKNVVTITISGPAGSGKSTLASFLAGHLAIRQHQDVTLFDDGQRQRLPDATSHLPPGFGPAIDIVVKEKA